MASTITGPDTNSQSGIYKSVFRKVDKLNYEMKEKLQLENWALYFNGKRIKNEEYQVLVLKNKGKEVKVAAICLPNRKAITVFEGMANFLDEYNRWKSINPLRTAPKRLDQNR